MPTTISYNKQTFEIIFVCHNIDSVNTVKKYNTYIIFVGDGLVTSEMSEDPKIIIARDLEYNIEYEKKLLTFTAWYLIIKNNLFMDCRYICILEWDVALQDTFLDNLKSKCLSNKTDVYSIENKVHSFLNITIDFNVVLEFLKENNDLGIDSSIIHTIHHEGWYPTTNHCIKRKILAEFVEWYYPICINTIKHLDYKYLSWYHERLFAIYLKLKNITPHHVEGGQHLNMCSHRGDKGGDINV
jgi:hypothetical protein